MSQRCHIENRQVGTRIIYIYDNAGNYNKSFNTYEEFLVYARAAYDAAPKTSSGRTYVGRGGTVGDDTRFPPNTYQFGAANPNQGDTDANSCMYVVVDQGTRLEIVCGYVRNFEEFVAVKLRTDTVAVYEQIEVCEQLTEPIYTVRLPTTSPAQPVETLQLTKTELTKMIAELHQVINEIEIAYQLDPSEGRARSLRYLNDRMTAMHQALASMEQGQNYLPSIEGLIIGVIGHSGTPTTQVTFVDNNPYLITYDDLIITDVHQMTQQELDDFLREHNLPPDRPVIDTSNPYILGGIIAAAIAGALAVGYAISEAIRKR